MKDYADRLKEFIKICYKGNTSAFASSIGKHKQAVYNVIKRKQGVGRILAASFEEAGLNSEWLLNGTGSMYSSNKKGQELYRANSGIENVLNIQNTKPSLSRAIKLFFSSVGAGSNPDFDVGSTLVDVNDLLGIKESTILVEIDDNDIEHEGIYKGDTLVIDTKASPKNYDLCLIEYKGSSLISRLVFKGSGTYIVPEDVTQAPIKINELEAYKFRGGVKNIIKKK
jgi:hypothetical protein